MFKKSDFLDEITALRLSVRPSTPKEIELWLLEYDLFSMGYTGEITSEVAMLCETAGELQEPAEAYNSLIKRYEKLKEKKMYKKIHKNDLSSDEIEKEKETLKKSWLNICNHELKVEIGTDSITLPAYKNTPRVIYNYITKENQPTFCREAIEIEVKNLPLPMPGINFVVSRETIRAMSNIALRLIKEKTATGETLYDFLVVNNITLNGKLRKLNPKNIKNKFPELDEFIQRNIDPENQGEYIKKLKRYISRDDIWAPGPRVRDKENNIEACKGLLCFNSIVNTIF